MITHGCINDRSSQILALPCDEWPFHCGLFVQGKRNYWTDFDVLGLLAMGLHRLLNTECF